MSKISDLLVSITLFFTPTQNIISSSISLSIIIMPAQAKTRSKTRSKSKSIKPKASQMSSRLNQTVPNVQIESTFKTEKRFARLNRVLKIQSPQQPHLETGTPRSKSNRRETGGREITSQSRESLVIKQSALAPREQKERKTMLKSSTHHSRQQERKVGCVGRKSKRKMELSKSSLSSSSRQGEPNQSASKKKSTKIILSDSPDEEQMKKPYKFDKAAFLLKQASNRVDSILLRYKFSRLVSVKLGFGKKLVYVLEFESKAEGRRVNQELYRLEIRVLGKILKKDLELEFLSGVLADRSR